MFLSVLSGFFVGIISTFFFFLYQGNKQALKRGNSIKLHINAYRDRTTFHAVDDDNKSVFIEIIPNDRIFYSFKDVPEDLNVL